MEMNEPGSILMVDDEELFRERLGRAFLKRGYIVFTAANHKEAMRVVSEHKPDQAVIDLKMPGKSGIEVLKDALAIHPRLQAIVLTGYGSIATATEAIKTGALNYLPKPADVDDIINAFGQEPTTASHGHQEMQQGADLEPPTLARAEWEHINRVLADCGGNISAAAERLGIHRRTLQRKLYKMPPHK